MSFLSPRQILRRGALSRVAVYSSTSTHGAPPAQLTRVLHLVILICVVNQLLTSEFMGRAVFGTGPSILLMLHEYTGMASLGLVLLFWLWTLVRRGETAIGRLFPWVSPRAIEAVLRDAWVQVKSLLNRDPLADGDGALATAIHGLGLLTLTGLTATGTVYFFTRGTMVSYEALWLHTTISNLMWVYLFGHAGFSVLHHLLGHDILRPMFWINRGISMRRGGRS